MISIKPGTQTWSSSPQQSSLKADPNNYLSADQKNKLSEEDIGTVANKIADPNYVDPKKVVRGHGDPELDKDAFFKLMLTQLKYQDPTSPMESHEMAAQLAQFSSLEKLSNIGESLDALKKGQEPSTNFQSLNLIGKAIRSDSSKLLRSEGDKTHDIGFDLKGDTVNTKITIMDNKGKVVRTLDIKNLKKGDHIVKWDGQTEDGLAARNGEYSVAIEPTNSSNQKVQVQTQVEGIINGINFTPSGPVLMVGNQTVRLSDVKKIWDAGVQTKTVPATEPIIPKQQGAIDRSKQILSPEQMQMQMQQADLSDVPMDDKLRSQVAKQTGG